MNSFNRYRKSNFSNENYHESSSAVVDSNIMASECSPVKRIKPADLQQLLDMGFPAQISAHALIRSEYDVQRAASWLVEHHCA